MGPEHRGPETPCRSRPVGLFDGEEELLDYAYGFAEVHIEVSSKDLDEFAEGSNDSFKKTFMDQKAAIRHDETSVAVVQYNGRGIVNIRGMECLVESLDQHFDILVGPLMSEQLDSVDLDANPEPYNRFVENTERFLGVVESHANNSAVLGTLPVLSKGRMEDLFEIQLEKNVDGFCIDFLGKKPTARKRIKKQIAPLVYNLGKEQLYRTSLLYAVNAYRGQNRTGTPRSPAENFFAFALGIDVLGDQYYFPRDKRGGDDEVQFRLFDRETYEQEYVLVSSLQSELPERTGLDHQLILDFARDDEQRGRAQVLLEVEQMNVAFNALRDAIHDGCTAEFITEKAGTLGRIETMLEDVQDSYDEGQSNPSVRSY